jgi:IPT/TIG domain
MFWGDFRVWPRRNATTWRCFLFATVSLLSSCGGGGGGGSGDGPSYSLSSGTVTFTAMQGGPSPAAQIINVNVSGGAVFVGTSQSGSNFSHVFQITGTEAGTITITPDAPVSPGTFTGSITVTGCLTNTCSSGQVAGSPKTISVTYVVLPAPVLTINPAAIDFSTATGVSPASISLDLSRSAGSSAWTSTIAYTSATTGWLSVTPSTAGTLPATISVNANVAAVPAGRHTANISFDAGGVGRVVPVTLTVIDPIVNFVSPYVATASTGGNVIIRGYGFASVSTGLQILFGATPASSVTFVSDTEIHATYPAFAAGSYSVTVKNSSLTLPTRARLVAVSPPAFAYTAIARTDSPAFAVNLTYDDERQAIYLVDPDRNRIEGYRYNEAAWIADTPLIVGGGTGNPRIALAPDGTELLKTTGSTMWRINPATLTTIGSVDALPLIGTGGGNLNLLAFANDGNAIGNSYAPASGVSLYRYDMLTRQFAALSTQSDLTNRTIVASGDGSMLVLPTFESLIPSFAKPIFTYSASTMALAQSAVTTTGTGHASVDRTGSRLILTRAESSPDQVTTVYNHSLVALGVLPDVAHSLRGFVISPDGSKAYVYYSDTGKIRQFDLNSPSGGGFVEIGSGTPVTDSPGTFFNDMTISADGGTLFLAGNVRVIVMPAP